jgi:hypothetical protein
MSSAYQKRFARLLKEDLDIDPEMEAGAMEGMLDDETNPDEFRTDQPAQDVNASVENAISQREQQMISQLNEWIGEMERFRDFMNGPEGNSIQKALADAEPETILDKMRNAEQRKIARVATELAALIESFKGYVAQSGNANLKYV